MLTRSCLLQHWLHHILMYHVRLCRRGICGVPRGQRPPQVRVIPLNDALQ